MNKASERYNTKVEIPISVILETIFSDDNKDVETLCRWAKKYGYVDLIKENGDKLGYYKLQDDYTKQSFYVWLDKEERKQYDYENYLLDELQRKNNIINELKESINNFDVFKEFTFPLMKRDEEQQVISSIDYEWKKSIKRPFIDKIKELEKM